MARVKMIERKQARVIVDLALEAARKILKKEGLTVEQASAASYDDATVTFKIRVTVASRVTSINKGSASMLGFSKDIIGESFIIKRTRHTIVGINLNRPKFPISTETQNGARYKFPAERVKRLLSL